MSNLIADFKPGPLDVYRKKASFDWKKMKLFIDTEDIVNFENEVYKIIRKYPRLYANNLTTKTLDEQRKIGFQVACDLKSIYQNELPDVYSNVKRITAFSRILTTTALSSFIKLVLSRGMFADSIKNMGTSRHNQFVEDAVNCKIFGCYCLTEIGHGSNTKGMLTTATYDKQKKVFVLNSPTFEAAKCWAGGLGQTASHAIVYAQLVIDNTHYGLHAFVVPLRDPDTLIAYRGLKIGDMGPKIGLNGIDNGFVQFLNYEIPRVNLLNKLADVTEEGNYVTPIKDPSKRHGAGFGVLSAGRVSIGSISESLGVKALTVAIRYAAVRKQFGPNDKEELPILEYQSHQLRLLPYLAVTYVLRIFNNYFSERFYKYLIKSLTGNAGTDAAEMGIEFHGITSASKPVITWIMKEIIQECREACGGHGYLHAAGLGDIRNENDPTLTYEGEGHVLIQQTINWLLKLAPQVMKEKKISSPLKSIDFLSNGLSILKNSKFTATNVNEVCEPDSIIKTFQWIVTFLLKISYEKVEAEMKSGKDFFTSKNNSQVFYGKSLAIAFIQHYSLQTMLLKISEAEDVAIKNLLTKIFSLFGLWAIDKWHMATLYQGGFASNSLPPTLIHDAILKLCTDLKDDAVALIDAIAVPDFILRSVLGASDGQVYKHLEESMTNDDYNMNRPSWWKDVVDFTQKNIANSKL